MIVQPGIGSSFVKLALWALTLIPAGDADPVRAALVFAIKAVNGRGQPTKENNVSHTLIPQNEAEDACDEMLQSKFCMFRKILLQAESERAMALARLQSVQTELNIKRALKPGVPRPGC